MGCPPGTLATPPPCGLWAHPELLCCGASTTPGPCAPVVASTCPEPSDTELIAAATTLLNLAVGGRYPGWCCQTDELCRPSTSQCSCDFTCDQTVSSACCTHDRLPVGSARWPIHSIVDVRYDNAESGPIVDPALYRLTGGNFLEHLEAGWPSCKRIYVSYLAGGVPLGGERAALHLACTLQRLWSDATSGCSIDVTAPLETLVFDASSSSEEARRSLFQVDGFVDQWVGVMIDRYPPTPVGAVWWPLMGRSRWTRTHVAGGLD